MTQTLERWVYKMWQVVAFIDESAFFAPIRKSDRCGSDTRAVS